MKLSLARTNAILSYEASADTTGGVGRFVILTAPDKVALVSGPNVKPFGLLLTDGKAGERVAVAICAGGLAGTVRVKAQVAVPNAGVDLLIIPNGAVAPDSGSGARVLVAHALETASPGELFEAVLFRPVVLTA